MKNNNNYYLFDRNNLKNEQYVLGIDEVGRGCWAGPLVVCGVLINGNYYHDEIKDSKLLNFQKRQMVYEHIQANKVQYVIKVFDSEAIDQYGPKLAAKILMTQIVNQLGKKAAKILIDYETLLNSKYQYTAIVKGDQTSFSIAAASIIAKQYRDEQMVLLDQKYPKYGFKNHKGYGTKQHQNALKKYGPIPKVHRFSYKPIKLLKLF